MNRPAKRQKTAVAAEDDARSFQNFVRFSCTDIKSGIVRFLSSDEVKVLRNTDLWRPHFVEDNGLDLYVKERGLQAGFPFTTFRHVEFYDCLLNFGIIDENRVGFSLGDSEPMEDAGIETDPPHSKVEIKNSRSRLQIHTRKIMNMFPETCVHIDAHCGPSETYGFGFGLSSLRADVAVRWSTKGRGDEWGNRVSFTSWNDRIHRIIVDPSMAHHPHHAYPKLTGRSWVAVHFIWDGMIFPRYPEYYPKEHVFKLTHPLPRCWPNFDADSPYFEQSNNASVELTRFKRALLNCRLCVENRMSFKRNDDGRMTPGNVRVVFETISSYETMRMIRQVIIDFPRVQVHLEIHSRINIPPKNHSKLWRSVVSILVPLEMLDQVTISSWGSRRIPENDSNRQPPLWVSASFTYEGVTFLANP